MTFEHYNKHPLHMVELKLNMIIPKNPNLINSIDRFIKILLLEEILILRLMIRKCVLNIKDVYDSITLSNCTNIENEDNNILFKIILLSIPSSIFYFP